MLISIIPKDPERSDFDCRDGEIDFVTEGWFPNIPGEPDAGGFPPVPVNSSLTINHSSLERNVRIPLLAGERPKAELMLGGDVSRVDPATAERLTQAMVEKAAELLLDISTDLRRQGLFILPFRFYTMTRLPDGTLAYPTPQGIVLPTDRPPHPEIVAAGVTDDCLTLSLRFPVKPHRLSVSPSAPLPAGHSLRTFISYPLYVPDPKEMRGSIGSVRSATGGQATGIRFGFLTLSALKASVAAPEKYYELVGNERTGYRIASKAAPAPDYSSYASVYGYVPPFPREALLAPGEDVDAETDPMDWIADWVEADVNASEDGETTKGYLPASLPYKYWHPDSNESSATGQAVWPEGIDPEAVSVDAEASGVSAMLLTRPMCFAPDAASRRHAEPASVRMLRVHGLEPGKAASAILYGSDDGIRWEAMRRFDPRVMTCVFTPRRLFWRLLLIGTYRRLALDVITG